MTAPNNQSTASSPGGPFTGQPMNDLPTPTDFKTAAQSLLRLFFSGAVTSAQLLRRYVLLIVALSLLGAGCAWAYRMLVAPRYEHTMLLQCNGSSRTAFSQVFAGLNSKAQLQKGVQLAAATGMPLSSAEKIIWIKTSFPEPLPNDDDSMSVNAHRMLVQLRTTERVLAPAVQSAMLRTVNETSYLRSSKHTEVAGVKEQLTFIEAQLKSLDSLHRSFTAALAKGITSTNKQEGMDAASTYQHAMDLQKEKGRLQTWLVEEGTPTTVVVPFYLSEAPMRLVWWLLLGALTGAAVGLLIAVLQWLKKWSVPS